MSEPTGGFAGRESTAAAAEEESTVAESTVAESTVRERQQALLDPMLEQVLARNPFYQSKYASLFTPDHAPTSSDLSELPFTEKSELDQDQEANGPYGTNLTRPIHDYTRVHQTSGTTGSPLLWLDTPESWLWWLDCWVEVFRAAGVTREDRIFIPFSFGPFIGFWAAFEAGPRLGALTIPAAGLTSEQRVDKLLEYDATILVCTPTYALRLAQIARDTGRDVRASSVRITLHAGEPGASLPNVKARIEHEWGAKCFDHAGATEVGAWGYGCGHTDRMHVNENAFVAEVIDPETLAPAPLSEDGVQRGELVLTNLGRVGSPVIRYRTGDLVELSREPCPCGRPTAWLRGGVLGRIDQMMIVRGINVYPAALDNIIRGHAAIDEYEVYVRTDRSMAELVVRIEIRTDGADGAADSLAADGVAENLAAGEAAENLAPDGVTERLAADDVTERLAADVHARLQLRPTIEVAEPGSLPRYELKASRFKGGDR